MTTETTTNPTATPPAKSMDDLVALCKRRGFIFPASEIYGGLNGFWDYGPLGTALKNNLRDAWWNDMVISPPAGPDGEPLDILGLDSAIIQHPRVWEASGHVAGFNDPMVDCRETKNRYRADHLWAVATWVPQAIASAFYVVVVASNKDEALDAVAGTEKSGRMRQMVKYIHRVDGAGSAGGGTPSISDLQFEDAEPLSTLEPHQKERAFGPDATEPGTLTEPRQFNLMFKTFVGATSGENNVAYLRPETAQGIFLNYRNILDTMRVKIPFGIAQIGKAFRNEVTPRNFIFRSREFEQMEIEFFCHGDDARRWYEFWCEVRRSWWRSVGLTDENLQLRQHDNEELAHYAKEGCGCFDVEYRFPFTHPGFGELEGVADRTDYDLRKHQEYSGAKLEYFDQERNERYMPHVIEPSAGLSRGVLAVLCEAFTPTPERSGSKYIMTFHPRLAPIKAAVFPLVAKDGMPEKARGLYDALRTRMAVQFDVKQSIGKRYARMDEAGTPFCFTIDGDTMQDDTITVRHRDTAEQHRINIDQAPAYIADHTGG
jgi:glycyl-tRNA synthetase